MISKIEQELGRKLDASRRWTVPTLNEVSLDMLDDLRRLSPTCINFYLMYHLKRGSESLFEDFVRDVVKGGADPKTWGYCDSLVLVIDGAGKPLTMSADGTRELLSTIAGARWSCLSVENAVEVNRAPAQPSLGAPGVLLEHAPYWWKTPNREVQRHLVSSQESIAEVSDRAFPIAFRRWIARRVTWWARHVDLASATAEQVVAATGTEPALVSADGAIALAALLREAAQPFDPVTQVRGYIGPDEWYAE